jgi:hypothetical protein
MRYEIFMRYEKGSLLLPVFQTPCPIVKAERRVEREEARNSTEHREQRKDATSDNKTQ